MTKLKKFYCTEIPTEPLKDMTSFWVSDLHDSENCKFQTAENMNSVQRNLLSPTLGFSVAEPVLFWSGPCSCNPLD